MSLPLIHFVKLTASAATGTPTPLSGPYPAVSADPAFPAQSGFRSQHFFPCLQSSDSCLWVYRGSWRGFFYAHVWKPTHRSLFFVHLLHPWETEGVIRSVSSLCFGSPQRLWDWVKKDVNCAALTKFHMHKSPKTKIPADNLIEKAAAKMLSRSGFW